MCNVHCTLIISHVCAQRDIVAVYNVLLKHTKETLNLMFCLSSAKLCMLTMLHVTLTLQFLYPSHKNWCVHAWWHQSGFISSHFQLPYSEKLSREKTFVNFAVLWLFAQIFSAKFGGVAPLVLQKRAIRESFLRENHIFNQFAKVFCLKSFLLYMQYNISTSYSKQRGYNRS